MLFYLSLEIDQHFERPADTTENWRLFLGSLRRVLFLVACRIMTSIIVLIFVKNVYKSQSRSNTNAMY